MDITLGSYNVRQYGKGRKTEWKEEAMGLGEGGDRERGA